VSAGGPFELTGQHAVVAGAVGPAGRALAMALAEAGARVSATTLTRDPAEEPAAHSILNECWTLGRDGKALTLDLTDAGAVGTAFGALEREVAPIDILVNAGHAATLKPALEVSIEEWRRELDRNVTGAFVTAQAAGRLMLARGHGRIVNIISVLHDRGLPNAALYGASQGALAALTRSLGLEWGRQGVNVSGLGVGFIDGLPGPQEDAGAHAILDRYIPLRRTGAPPDLAGALLLLVNRHSGFLNAEIVTVDGGIAAHA